MIRPFLDTLDAQLRRLWHAGEALCLDESMIPFFGRSTLKQHMPKKPVRFGFKVYVTADATCGWPLRIELAGPGGCEEDTVGLRMLRGFEYQHKIVAMDR